jgi:CYTH domain-containing protein
MIEIERKFLVIGDFYRHAVKKENIVQGYLCVSAEWTIRARIKGKEAFITLKRPNEENGFSHLEYEYPVPYTHAVEIINLCRSTIEKERYYVPYKKDVFEVDVFHGAHEGLVIAELELLSEDEEFYRPDWLGEEVTGDERYYNSYLSEHPFTPSNHS